MSKTIKLESHHFYRTKFSYRYVLGIFFFLTKHSCSGHISPGNTKKNPAD